MPRPIQITTPRATRIATQIAPTDEEIIYDEGGVPTIPDQPSISFEEWMEPYRVTPMVEISTCQYIV